MNDHTEAAIETLDNEEMAYHLALRSAKSGDAEWMAEIVRDYAKVFVSAGAYDPKKVDIEAVMAHFSTEEDE